MGVIYLLDVVVKVAIIGAGISGIGSSLSLTQTKTDHIIIQARNRTGGRITSKKFDGISIQLGAAFVHKVTPSNRIAQIVKQEGWNNTLIDTSRSYFSYEGLGPLDPEIVGEGIGISDQLCKSVALKQNSSTRQLSLQQATVNYFQSLVGQKEEAINTGKWFYNLIANYNGAKFNDLGSGYCSKETVDKGDYQINEGYSTFLQNLYKRIKPRKVYLDQTVKKIDYSGKFVKIYTQNKVYYAQKVISSLPLGVLQSQSVEFCPKLPQTQTKAFFDLGNGIYNKVFASFEEPFWDLSLDWVDFITKDRNNKYPASISIVKQGRYVLCFFVSDENSKKISKFTNQELHDDLLSFLKRFYPNKDIKIRAVEATSWHADPYSLGSYTYERVGRDHAQASHKICATVCNKIWFVGEHCHPKLYSYSHGAFETGIWAAENITALLK